MPIEQKVPTIPEVVLSDVPLPKPFRDLKDDYALSLVTQTFQFCENQRQWTDNRWRLNDEIYAAYVPPKYWPGTKILRASLGFGLAFEQVEGAYPAVCQALFAQPEYFSLEAEFGANQQAVRMQQAHVEYGLETSAMLRGMTQDMEFKLALKDMLVYGNGGVKVEYDASNKLPSIYRVDPRNIYVDPRTPTPSLSTSRCVIERQTLTVQEIQAYEADSRMNVPSEGQLWTMAQSVKRVYADIGVQAKEALRGNQFSPGASDNLPFPGDKQIEVLMYYSKDRIIWILNREWVLYNERNPYGKIPFFFAPCYTFPGRYYAQSIVDQQEGNQNYIQALFNNRLDNVTLKMFPPRWMQRDGAFQPTAQMWGPGSVFYSEDPKNGINVHDTEDVTQNVYQELGFIQANADRRTGITSMMSGVPMPSNANRSATGVTAQQQGTQLRIYPLVDNFENFVISPAINMVLTMIRLHTAPAETLPGMMREEGAPEGQGQFVQVPAAVFSQGAKVRVRAASRMLSRDRLAQLYQFVAQNMLQGPVVQALQQRGETVDVKELMTMLMDATGVARRYMLVRPMDEQEKQFMQQQQQAQAEAQNQGRMQEKQLEAQTRERIMDKKIQGDMQKEQMKSQGDPMEAQAKQREADMKMRMEEMKMQMEQMKAQMDMHMKEQDLKIQERKSQLELAVMESKARIEGRAQQEKMQMEQVKMAQGLQHDNLQRQLDLQHSSVIQGMEREGMFRSLEHEDARGAIKTKLENQKLKRDKTRADMKRETLGKGKE